MSSDVQGITDGGAAPRALVPGEAAAGPPAAAVSTQSPTPAATSNVESEAPAGANSYAERVRRVRHKLRRGKPPGADHPVWDYFSVYVKEAYKFFSVCLLCDRLGRHEQVEIRFSNGSPTNLVHNFKTRKEGHKKAYEDVTRKMKDRGPGGVRQGGAGREAAGSADISSYFMQQSQDEASW